MLMLVKGTCIYGNKKLNKTMTFKRRCSNKIVKNRIYSNLRRSCRWIYICYRYLFIITIFRCISCTDIWDQYREQLHTLALSYSQSKTQLVVLTLYQP